MQGLIASVFGIAAVGGPSLGAFLVEHAAWQVVFWVNLPVGAAAVAMISAFLREDVKVRSHRIDILGSLLMAASMGALMLVLIQGAALPRTYAIGIAAMGVIFLVMFLAQELRTPEPMLALDLLRDRVIMIGSVGGGLAGAVMMGVSAFLPTYVQGAMGRSATMAGLVLGAMSVTWALSSIFGGRLMVRTSYRLAAILGALVAAGRLRRVGWADAGARRGVGDRRLAGHRHRHGTLQHRVHRLDPGRRPVEQARCGHLLVPVPAVHRPGHRVPRRSAPC